MVASISRCYHTREFNTRVSTVSLSFIRDLRQGFESMKLRLKALNLNGS